MDQLNALGTRSHELWRLFEPLHAVTYFSAESREAFEAVGLRGFWRGYFAGRLAPLGSASASLATACLFGFHPDFVARAVPEIWSTCSPADTIAARRRGAAACLRPILADATGSVARCAELLRAGIVELHPGGRPLFGANLSIDWPDDPFEALWQGATLWREHRGDGHIVALGAAAVGPCAAHVLRLAADGSDRSTIQPHRGWSDDDWSDAQAELTDREWIEGERLTPLGRDAVASIADMTNRLAIDPLVSLGSERTTELERLLDALAPMVTDRGVIPYPNAMGVPRP